MGRIGGAASEGDGSCLGVLPSQRGVPGVCITAAPLGSPADAPPPPVTAPKPLAAAPPRAPPPSAASRRPPLPPPPRRALSPPWPPGWRRPCPPPAPPCAARRPVVVCVWGGDKLGVGLWVWDSAALSPIPPTLAPTLHQHLPLATLAPPPHLAEDRGVCRVPHCEVKQRRLKGVERPRLGEAGQVPAGRRFARLQNRVR